MYGKVVQYFAFKPFISMLYSSSMCPFFWLSLHRVWFLHWLWRRLCPLYTGLKGWCVSAHGCNFWLETAWFSLPLFFEAKHGHESQYLQHCLRVCYGKHSLAFLQTLLLLPTKRQVMASGCKRLKSAIYHTDMQKQVIAFNKREAHYYTDVMYDRSNPMSY